MTTFKKFTLAATPGGRDRSRSATKAIIPRISELKIEQGPSPQRAPQRLPEEAPVEVCIYKITDRAGDLWAPYEGTSAQLFQIQFDHRARPSVC